MEHARVDEVWAHACRVDICTSIRRQFVVETVREANTAVLGGAVVDKSWTTDQAGHAGNVDDVAVLLLQHRRQEALHRLSK